jgi:hypothetical protein
VFGLLIRCVDFLCFGLALGIRILGYFFRCVDFRLSFIDYLQSKTLCLV